MLATNRYLALIGIEPFLATTRDDWRSPNKRAPGGAADRPRRFLLPARSRRAPAHRRGRRAPRLSRSIARPAAPRCRARAAAAPPPARDPPGRATDRRKARRA